MDRVVDAKHRMDRSSTNTDATGNRNVTRVGEGAVVEKLFTAERF